MDDDLNYEPINDSSINNTEIIDYLYTTSKWANFLAILGYIGVGIMVIVSIGLMIAGMSVFGKNNEAGLPLGIIGIFYLPIAILYFFPVNYMYKFALRIRRGIDTGDPNALKSGFKNLKSLFKFSGILTIVLISLYIVVFIGIIAMSALFMPKG